MSFTRTFINTCLNIDGTPFTNEAGYATQTFAQETQGRDMRLRQTIRMGSYTRTDNGKTVAAPPVFSYTYTGYMPIKFTLDDTYYDGGTTRTNSITLMRYAEILLNYARRWRNWVSCRIMTGRKRLAHCVPVLVLPVVLRLSRRWLTIT
nr:RagB/SusD family nutrient uptake outer membrane protein [Chitinophaga pinensis]